MRTCYNSMDWLVHITVEVLRVLAQSMAILIILPLVRYSLCGAGLSLLTALISLTTLAGTVITGPLEPTLALATPTTSTSVAAASIRPTAPFATSASPFAALSLLHSPSLGRRRR